MKNYILILVLGFIYPCHISAQNAEWKSITREDFIRKTLSYNEDRGDFYDYIQTIDTRNDSILSNQDLSLIKYRVFIDKAGNSYFWEDRNVKKDFVLSLEIINGVEKMITSFGSDYILQRPYSIDSTNNNEQSSLEWIDIRMGVPATLEKYKGGMIISNGKKEVAIIEGGFIQSSVFVHFLRGYYYISLGMSEQFESTLSMILGYENKLNSTIDEQVRILKKYFIEYPKYALDTYPQYVPPQLVPYEFAHGEKIEQKNDSITTVFIGSSLIKKIIKSIETKEGF